METYILKAIICSTVLIILYFLFLQRERSFKFNRFYLLFVLLFSYAIPLISLKLPAVETPKSNIIFQESASEVMIIPAQTAETTFDWSIVLLCIYVGVAFFLLLKSMYSVTKILQLKGNLIKINGQKTKILVEDISPFSFMNTLYIGKIYCNNENSIDQRIFLHEKVHINQKHSLDLILVEILLIISWFNPALYFYKKAIVTNHEFLADENVISKDFDIKSYQQLILKEISERNNLQFTNQFNYHNTKKRFIMMTKPNSRFSKVKKILAIPTIFALAFLFVQKTYAMEANIIETNKNSTILSKEKSAFPMEKDIELQNGFLASTVNIKEDTIKKPEVERKALEAAKEVNYKMPPAPSQENVKKEDKQSNSNNVPPSSISALTEVEQLPEFPGGFNAFRNLLASSFNVEVIKGDEKLIKSTIYFVIDVDGKVSDVSAQGENEIFNKEAVRTAKAVNENQLWKPAMKDGKPVRYRFTMPLTMSFGS